MITALQFSGGKDSLACLYINRDRWQDEDFLVMWANTGLAYQATIDLMDKWRKRVRNFIEVRSDASAGIDRYGIPADIVPMTYTHGATSLKFMPPYLIQSGFQCCILNIWGPMQSAIIGLGVEEIVRGQRDSEGPGAKIVDGQVIEGITYRLPLQNWSENDVFAYLREVGAEIPDYYQKEASSQDCWSCTAYLGYGIERIRRLPDDKRAVVMGRLKMIDSAIASESHYMPLFHDDEREYRARG